jgi:type IV conjugative transfer system protein TraL
MDQYYIPKYLDAPRRILIFTVDEAITIGLLFVIFVFFLKQQILAIIVCGLAYFGLKRLKGDRGPTYIRRLIYWHLPPIIKFKQIPPSYKRKFVG